MPRSRADYPPTNREQIIALARASRTSKEFEPSEQTIRNWIFQAEADRGERPRGLTTDEREELSPLRCENRQLKLERDILGNPRPGSHGSREKTARLFRFVTTNQATLSRPRRVGERVPCVAQPGAILLRSA